MQPTKKISQLPPTSAPTVSDKVPLVSGGTTDYALISDLIALFFTNIPSGAHSDVTRWAESGFDYVASGGVWSGDSYAVNRNASMTAMIIYINGRRISIAAVTSRTFTASKDTYIDVLDNLDGTGTLVYTEATNNAASAALAANSVRIGIIVTGATTIAAVGSVNQGQESKILPIASSIAYSVTDSLGNLICPRDPTRRMLGMKMITSNFTTTNTTNTNVTGLTCPVICPANRKVKIKLGARYMSTSAALGTGVDHVIQDATAGVVLEESAVSNPTGGFGVPAGTEWSTTPPASGSRTYQSQVRSEAAGTTTLGCAATTPGFIMVELT